MRRHGPIRVLLSLLLAAWLPWCLCDRVAMECCDRAEAKETSPEATVEATCGGSCCASHEAPLVPPPASDDPCRPFGQCEAGCCVTKGLVSAPQPGIPVDSIGAPLPATLVAVVPDASIRLAEPAARDDIRTAGPRAGPGRADSARGLLAAICVRTT